MPDVQCGLIGCGTVGDGVVARWAEEVEGALPVVALLRLGLSPGTVRAFEGVAFLAEDAFLAQARDEENAILLDRGLADAALTPHYVRVSRPLGSAAPQRALLDAFAAEGVGVAFVSAGRLGWVQAVTSRVPRERVSRALAPLDSGEIAHVTFHESARGAASFDQPALAAAGGSR